MTAQRQDSSSATLKALFWLGDLVLFPLHVTGGVARLFWRALAGIGKRGWPKGEVARQAFSAGNRSLVLVSVTMASVGMVLVYHGGLQAQQILGDMSPVGPAFIQILLREFGPTIVALMLAARVGGGVAAELGSMVVTEQIDALRMNAADPVGFLVSPRLVAVWGMTLVMTVFGCGVAVIAGAVTARALFDVPYPVFLNLALTTPGDLITGLVKAAAFGAYVPTAAAWAGLSATPGSRGVGRAATSAVVVGSMGVIVLTAIIGAITFSMGL